MPNLDQVSAGASAITQINANEQAMQVAAAYGRRASTSSGLTLGYYGATLQDGTVIAAGTVTVGASTTTYVVVNRSTGAVSSSTSNTNWNDTTTYMRMALLVSNGSGITSYTDSRPIGGLGGGSGGSGTVTSVGFSWSAKLTDILSIGGTPVTTSGTLAADAVDPGADRIVFWDDSASKLTYLTLGANLSITGTTLDAAGASRTPAIQSVTSASTVTPTFSDDMVKVTALAAAMNLANPTGTPIDGLGMVIRIKDNGTARALTYGTQYRAIGVTLPTTTVISKTLYMAMIYNSDDTKWDVIAVGQEA